MSHRIVRPSIFLLLLALCLTGAAQAQGPLAAAPSIRTLPNGAAIQSLSWHVETADASPSVGEYSSLELYAGLYPFAVYYDRANGNLKSADRAPDSSWQARTIDEADDVGQYASFASNGLYSYVSYIDATSGGLKYAGWDGWNWNIEAVDGLGQKYTAIAVNADTDEVHIAYQSAPNGNLNHATRVAAGGNCGGGAWQCDVIDVSPEVGWDVSIALDAIGRPHVAYYDRTNMDLKYAYRDGTTWYVYTVDNAGDVGQYTSIAMGYGDVPSISYYDVTHGDLKFASYVGTGGSCGLLNDWNCTTLDSDGYVGLYTSLDMHMASGYLQPAISYYDLTNGNLKFAVTGYMGLWFIYTIDSAGDVGRFTSLEIDSANNPHITYYDVTNGHLKYAGAWYDVFLPVVRKNR